MTDSKGEKNSIERVIELAEKSDISSIKSIVSGIIEIINNPKSTAKDLKELINADPPLTAKVLKVSNSAYYGGRGRISDIEQAVIWIGFDTLKEIALSQKVCELFQKEETINGYSRPLLWRHCIAVALLCRLMYRMEFGERGENAYAAGLLHDIGIILEDQFLQNDFRRILTLYKTEGRNLFSAEDEVLGYNHAQLGRTLASRWNFPGDLVHAIGEHHTPARAPAQYERITLTTYVSDYLCQQSAAGFCDAPHPDKKLFEESLKLLGFHALSVEIIVKEMTEELNAISERGFFE
jgi:putative nucleotidyltransferase with HDIG domain